MKNKLKLLKIKLLLYGSLTASTLATGCSAKKESITQMSETQEFDLDIKDSSDYKIIHVINSFERENTYFVKTLEFEDLNKYEDNDKYRKYFTIKNFSEYNSILYIDVFSGIVVSVKHTNKNETLFSFSTVLEEENAYDYISSYLDEKDYYNKEEIEMLLLNSNEKKLVKQK